MPRAHIFQSFDALKGFSELIEKQNRIVVKKRILSEDKLQELEYQIKEVQVGMMVRLVYYDQNDYVQVEGIVTKLNFDTKIIQIVKEKINIKNIVEIEFI